MAGPKYASGKWAIAECDVCGFRYKLKELKRLVIKTKNINVLACPTCWTPDHPQLQLGMYPVYDPQAVENPRRDNSYYQAGLDGLQIYTEGVPIDDVDAFGVPTMGSRIIQWGWNPVGLNNGLDILGLPNDLVAIGETGTVTVVIT